MSLSLSQVSKSALSVTNDAKGLPNKTWDGSEETWDEAVYTWDAPKSLVTMESKANLTITNQSKN